MRDIIRKAFYEKLREAKEKYDLVVDVETVFVRDRRFIAQCHHRGNSLYTFKFNEDAADVDIDYIIHNSISHEIAHMVCYEMGDGFAHDITWKKVHRSLGGNGKRCCNSAPINKVLIAKSEAKSRRRRKAVCYEYVATCGSTVEISLVRHNKIKKGEIYNLRSTGGRIHRGCAFRRK